ncbi:MAG: GyrI-like domain-containing protein [Pirellulaceae bacterium]|nr:GyrI-like domain-containing protein [Pirellulaceae bacterium]
MKVMVIVKATQSSEAGEMPSTELLAAMGRYNEELVNAGIMLAGEGLHPSSQGARVRFSGNNRTVVDGPFTETKELIAGFWLWKVDSMQQAIDWVKRCPNPMSEDSDIEIRRVFEAEDFGEPFTPELREQEASQRARTLGLNAPNFTDAPATTLAGLNQTYTMETRIAIPQQWARFVPMADRLSSSQGKPFYGVSWNTQPDCSFDYLTGFEVADSDDLPAEFTTLSLAAGRYAIFAHTGHVSALPKTIDTIWTKWVPECGLKIAQAPCLERYTSEFDPVTGMGGMEIWLPLAT